MPQDDHEQDAAAPGWDALGAALSELYGGAEPLGDFAPEVPYMLGGKEPLDAVRVYATSDPVPHWHLVGFGLSELYEKTGSDPELSGFGIEFSIRVARGPDESAPPGWPVILLQQLAKYVFAERPFAPGHTIHVARGTFGQGPGQEGPAPTLLAALAFDIDPELGVVDTPNGAVAFLQVAALTEAEYAAARGGKALEVLARVAEQVPLHVVDRERASVL
ncbi:suppressor of fused domain protein [Allonocardiopsis opalescens]|uniref:Suppressor of fused protein SUFU n=1 Tax=Allonocardiopsis opalescens TaxID=1144618 RepID=A0A2T0Q276_9ACTN|nr:suppressor of fused domain protein [Allonocardiopsis opalescens]PRX97881.1 suppressor of fused protein SUFU [Allonocardiopsis opalescens]